MRVGDVSLRTDFDHRSRRAMIVIVSMVVAFGFIAAGLLTWRAGSGLCELSKARLENEAPALAKELMIGSQAQVNTLLALARERYPKGFAFELVQQRANQSTFSCAWNPLGVSFELPLTFAGEPVGVLRGSSALAPWWAWAVGILVFALSTMLIMWRLTSSYHAHLVAHVIDPISRLAQTSRHSHGGAESSTSEQVADGEGNVLYREVDFLRTAIIQWKRSAQYEAVARTTQALAHDVRKPFSIIKLIIQAIEMEKDAARVNEILKMAMPEVEQAMVGVEGMIQDVMQIGSDVKPNTGSVSPVSLAHTALVEMFRIEPEAQVTIQSQFHHSTLVDVDSTRIARVFANVIGNAIQAMKKRGKIWIHTAQRGSMVEFTLGNSGSYIPAENHEKIFDSFFTSGKKDGTGLGLAIARRIVELHGGKITCKSNRGGSTSDDQVEFVFTLPASPSLDNSSKEQFPKSATEIRDTLAMSRIAKPVLSTTVSDEEIEGQIQMARSGATAPMVILVVDDEAIYRNGLCAFLERSNTLNDFVRIEFASDDKTALQLAGTLKPALVIQDIDLGSQSLDGIEVVRSLRASEFQGKICIHSNRFLTEDTRVALEAGADMVLPKPMSRSQFIKLILAASA